MNIVEKAVKTGGGLINIARILGVRYQQIQNWRTRGFVPFNRIKAIEQATNGAVMRHEFYPEIFEGYEPVNVHYPKDEGADVQNQNLKPEGQTHEKERYETD